MNRPLGKKHLLLAIVFGTAVLLWATTPVITIFELDGNSADDGSNLIPDWNTLNGTTGQNGTLAGANIKTFVTDADGATIFTGGGSKDELDIPSWKQKAGSVPDKDELQHAYAASFSAANGDTVIAFGADREATNGTANIGIWFFQNAVSTNNSGGFNGSHVNGDVFIVSSFTQGGGTVGIQVYEWDTTCAAPGGVCAATNIRTLFNAAQTCQASGTGHEACAKVNSSDILVSWPYSAKFAVTAPNNMPTGAYFEGAINLTELFAGTGQSLPCFASFLVETRSSATFDAVLKDFVAGSFPQCSISLTKSCACTGFRADGSGYDYSFDFTVTNSGGGSVFQTTVTDQGKSYDCGTLTAGQSKTRAQCTGPAPTFFNASSSITNTANASANTSSDGTGATLTATAQNTCTAEGVQACTPNPALTVTKSCVTTLEDTGSNVVVRVDFIGTVTNGGNVNVNNVAVGETHGGGSQSFSAGTLTPGQSKCYTNGQASCPTLPVPAVNQPVPTGAASYYPSQIDTVLTPNGRAEFKDRVRATGTTAFGAAVESHPSGQGQDAKCAICPLGFCELPPSP